MHVSALFGNRNIIIILSDELGHLVNLGHGKQIEDFLVRNKCSRTYMLL